MYCSRLSGSGWGGGGGGVDNSKGVGKNSVMTPYVRVYLANIKNANVEWRNSRNGIILITGLHAHCYYH